MHKSLRCTIILSVVRCVEDNSAMKWEAANEEVKSD